jgi:hypothetical protein
MKLDTKYMRYLTQEDWKVLTAVSQILLYSLPLQPLPRMD